MGLIFLIVILILLFGGGGFYVGGGRGGFGGLGTIIQYCAEQWVGFWSPAARPAPDTSYDEVPQEQIRRMNEHAKSAFAKGNWVTETLDP